MPATASWTWCSPASERRQCAIVAAWQREYNEEREHGETGDVQVVFNDTGRHLLDLGIIPMDNMLPETAYAKLAWVLGQTDDPATNRGMMTTAINHEITPREPHNGYLILQGGLPEVEAFVMKHWK